MWLGEPDPVASMEEMREEDAELTNIREFFALWPAYMMMSTPLAAHVYTVARMIEIACEQKSGNFNTLDLELFFLRVAQTRGEISPDRLGRWLKAHQRADRRRLPPGEGEGLAYQNRQLLSYKCVMLVAVLAVLAQSFPPVT